MSQGFNLRYDQLRQNDLTNRNTASEENTDANEVSYPRESNVRNVCFVQLDGSRIFLNYGYLVSGEYLPEQEMITLGFTSHTIILKGVHLESLFYDLMQHIPKQIICFDARYNTNNEKGKPVVNELKVKIL